MDLFGVPYEVSWYYWASIVVVPVVTEIVLRSKWWKQKQDYYFSFNDRKDGPGNGMENGKGEDE